MIRPGPEKHGVWPNLSLDNALLILGGCRREMKWKKGPSCCTRRNPRSLRKPRHHGKEKAPLLGLDFEMVDRRGLEPRTLGLRVPCSTN